MEDKLFLDESKKIITEFRSLVKSDLPNSKDKQRVLQLTNSVLSKLSNKTKLDNKVFIEMEKFYQNTSMIIGLSGLDLKGDVYDSWKVYDKFHFEYVKPNLKLYGNTFLI